MRARIARRPLIAAIIARVVAGAVVYAIVRIAGAHRLGRAFDHPHPGWIAVAIVAQAASLPAYVLAYRAAVAVSTGRRLVRSLTVELVLSGFGPFAFSSGFSFDDRSLRRIGLDARQALRTVLDLGGLEFLALVWIAFAAAVGALIWDGSLAAGLIWPWLIAVPVGTAIAVLIARAEPPSRVSPERTLLHELAAGLADVLGIARHPVRSRGCWVGILGYWLADMATLYATLRTFGLDPPWESFVLAYATGYLLSRRSLPLAGAGFVELLLSFSLNWTGLPLASALAAVIVYRAISFGLAALPALVARARLRSPGALEHPFELD